MKAPLPPPDNVVPVKSISNRELYDLVVGLRVGHQLWVSASVSGPDGRREVDGRKSFLYAERKRMVKAAAESGAVDPEAADGLAGVQMFLEMLGDYWYLRIHKPSSAWVIEEDGNGHLTFLCPGSGLWPPGFVKRPLTNDGAEG